MAVSKGHPSNTLVPVDFFESLSFWSELTGDERKTLKTETVGFFEEMKTMRQSRSRAVAHLMRVQDILYAKGHMVKYMQSLAQSGRSSYRWLNRAKELALPPAVLEAAADRGLDLIHASYVNPIRELPPSKGLAEAAPDDPKVTHYLERIEALRGEQGASEAVLLTTQDGEKRAWRAVMREYKRMGRGRAAWGLRLISHLMAAMALPAQRIEPDAIPEDFVPKAGYPKGRPRR